MKDNQEIVIVEDDDSAPPKKKLKQARLPFQILSPVAKPALDSCTNKKRKLSEDSDVKVTKIVKCDESVTSVEVKENVCGPVKSEKNENNIKSGKTVTESECCGPLAVKDNENNAPYLVNTKCENHNADNSVAKNKSENSASSQNGEEVTSEPENSPPRLAEDEPVEDASSDSDESSDEDSVKQSISSESQNHDEVCDSSILKVENGQEHDLKNGNIKEENSEKSESSDNCENGDADLKDEYLTPVKPEKVNSDIKKATRSTDKVSSKRMLTPKESTPKTSPEGTPTSKKLTPKQLQKQMESAKKKEEKERQRLEKERKKAEEKEEKQRQKIEKEEQKKKEKEEKEEQKKKEKEEKERKRLAELEVKLEEKKQKEEEKRKKEEQRLLEKKKKDEKKQAEEDAKRKVAAAFTSYFLAKKSDCKSVEEIKDKPSETFMPFEVKSDMRLAPLCRLNFEEEQRNNLDRLLNEQNPSSNYLNDLRNKVAVPRKSLSTWPVSEKSDVVVIEDDPEDEIVGSTGNQVVELHPDINLPRPKLLQFWDNRRPPYWGTWQKKSSVITQKKPFSKDEKIFDYEVDSDDEWEEEEPGESLNGSDDEKESEDEYEVDNDFFVPHGYLSDEENLHGDDEEKEIMSPESQKAKLKMLEHEFEEEMKQKTERLKPKVIGCIWRFNLSDAGGSQLRKFLSSRCAVYRDAPIVTSKPDHSPKSGSPTHESDTIARRPKKRRFPESAVAALIRLIHGNTNGTIFLVKEFITYYRKFLSETNIDEAKVSDKAEIEIPLPISKNSTSKKIRELASWTTCPDEGPLFGRNCWYVPLETRAFYGLSDLEAGNKQWEYNLKPKRRDVVEVSPVSSPVTVVTEPKPSMSITKFTKKLSREECQKQLRQDDQLPSDTKLPVEIKPPIGIKTFFAKSSEVSPSQKKRVPILASTARGKKLPEAREIINKMKTPNKKVDLCNTISKCKKAVSESTQNSGDIKAKDGELSDSSAKNNKLPDTEKEKCITGADKEIVCIDLDD